jgi:hypothetical protein
LSGDCFTATTAIWRNCLRPVTVQTSLFS